MYTSVERTKLFKDTKIHTRNALMIAAFAKAYQVWGRRGPPVRGVGRILFENILTDHAADFRENTATATRRDRDI
jgi:uncharacterized protein YyaL (SSP411 family)